MFSHALPGVLLAATDVGGEGLDVLTASLPTNPGAIFVLAVAFAAIGVTIYYGRENNASGVPKEDSDPPRPERPVGESSEGGHT